MTSFDKVVKLACKPKPTPPKPKYLDSIIAATWTDGGAVHDVCKALSPRFREPNAIVVFKALIVLHTMIRNGATDNVLSYLSSSDVLRLQNVSSGNWEGYKAPQNLQNYAIYLDSRIRAYRELKRDPIRVQAESNRDIRMSTGIYEQPTRTKKGNKTSSGSLGEAGRSKPISEKKLRVITIEKGLLRETKAVQRVIDTLVECRFYLDDLEDELTITALRMSVKDLLILFQAGNEGVINVLEHYLEMSHVDAQESLDIYLHFVSQTDRVVEYLGVAKKLQNLLNVSIPNLKHAPVSLAASLQEHLNDPNFEQNRRDYRLSKANSENGVSSNVRAKSTPPASAPTPAADQAPAPTPSSSTALEQAPTLTVAKPEPSRIVHDFFSAIEEERPTVFNPSTGSPQPINLHQQPPTNPFPNAQLTGAVAFGQGPANLQSNTPFGTGFIMPQYTAFPPPQQPRSPSNPFAALSQPTQNTFTQFQPSLLQPQPTGVNPFRQSMMFPQMTGAPPSFGAGPGAQGSTNGPPQFPFTGEGYVQSSLGANTNPFSRQGMTGPLSTPIAPLPASPSTAFPGQQTFTSQPQFQPPTALSNLPTRPASTPLTAQSNLTNMSFVKSHPTGSKNPFGVPVPDLPPIPKQPTLMELALAGTNGFGGTANVNGDQGSQPTGALNATGGGGSLNSGAPQTDMAGVASSFLFKKDDAGKTSMPSFVNSQNTATTTTMSTPDTLFSSLSSNTTGMTTISGLPASSLAVSPLKRQVTGFRGIKPFKPSSSFGASLLESLSPIPQSTPDSTTLMGQTAASTPAPGATTAPSFLSQQPTGFGTFGSQLMGGPTLDRSNLGVGLRPQITGGGVNPFRASMAVMGGSNSMGGGHLSTMGSTPMPAFSAASNMTNGTSGGAKLFGMTGAGTGMGTGGQ